MTVPHPQAIDTYEELERTLGPSNYSLTAVIDVHRRMGNWRRALALLERLAALGVSPEDGLRTCTNSVIASMGSAHYAQARRLAARAAREWGVRGDVVTYGTLLLASSELAPPTPTKSPSGFPPFREALGEGTGNSEDGDDAGGGRAPRNERSLGQGGGVARGGGRGAELEPGTARLASETVELLRRAAWADAVPGEACLNMVMFNLSRGGAWAEAAAFLETMESLDLKVSRSQVRRRLGGLAP